MSTLVTNELSSDARNSATWEISSGLSTGQHLAVHAIHPLLVFELFLRLAFFDHAG
jgi:hypothetical protein